ncbi:fibrinogen-like protein A [Glandiceps talaboti]
MTNKLDDIEKSVDTLQAMTNKLDDIEKSVEILGKTLQDPNSDSRNQIRDCYDVQQSGYSSSGNYIIQPQDDGEQFRVYCDMETDSGGWTVFQRRMDGRLDFFRNWQSYKDGFGNVNAEFWLGNDKLFRLTNQRVYQLRVDMEDFDGKTAYALYGQFAIGDETSGYKLVIGDYSGTAG